MSEKATMVKGVFAAKASTAKALTRDFATATSDRATEMIDQLGSVKRKTSKFVQDERTKGYVASAVGGAAIVGVPSAALCLVGGGAIGATLGLIPAIFTLGLSVPVGAMIGGCCGTAVGATAGSAVGAALGCGIFNKQAEITLCAQNLEIAGSSRLDKARYKANEFLKLVRRHVEFMSSDAAAELASVRVHLQQLLATGQRKAAEAAQTTKQFLSDRAVQVSAASAAGSAAVLGVGGGAAGLVAGGTLGAAIGVIPAIFTFGLSIPVGAAIGGGCGIAAGVTTGVTVGFLGGGAGGYRIYARRSANKAQAKGSPSDIDALSSTGGCS
jgi:hypothetical protein